MTNRKKLAALSLISLFTIATVIAVDFTESTVTETAADEGEHTGNHYTQRDATENESGCKEYWVCCECHEHYLTAPTTGNWTDAGVATEIVDSTDDRFIAPSIDIDSLINQLKDIGFTNVSVKDDGQVSIKGYNGASGDTIIIPEGVTTIAKNCFAGHPMKYIVIPESCTRIAGGLGTGPECIWYFVGKYVDSKEVKKYCEVLNTGWHYENGEPTADVLTTRK